MELQKTFETQFPPDAVWAGLSDVRLVASCLPGAAVTEEISADEYKGKLKIKVGPLQASFDGLISIERRPEERVAVVTGKGSDAKSSSRVTAKMTYRVEPAGTSHSLVEIRSDINLAGALAQFSKAAVMQEIANRMTDEFVRKFEERLALAHPPAQADAADVLATTSPPAAPAAAPSPPDPAKNVPPAPEPEPEPAAFDAGNLLWSMFKQKLTAFFRKLFG